MEFKDLVELMQKAVKELHDAVERQDAEIAKFGEPLAETKTAIEKIQADITALQTSKDELEVKLQRTTVPALGTPGDKEPTAEQKAHKDAFYKFIRQGVSALNPDERKALVEDATGQYLIEPELDAEIVRELPKITVIRPLATVRTIGKDRLKIRSIGGVTVGWGKLETGKSPTESTLTPGAPIYQYVEDLYGLAKIGEDELMDTDVPLEPVLAEEFSRALGEEEDKQFVVGDGHDVEEPEGITKCTQLITDTKTTNAHSAVIVEDFLDMLYGCPTQFRRNGVFIMNSTVELAIRKLRAKSGTEDPNEGPFLWQPSVAEGRPNTFLGKAIYTQDDLEDLTGVEKVIAIFGDMRAGYRIVDRQGMTIQRLTELYSEAGLVGFKIHKRVTGGVMRSSQKPLVLLTEHAA